MPAAVQNLSQLVEKSIFLSIHIGVLGTTRKINLTDNLVALADPETVRATGGVVVTTDADSHYLKAQKTLMESDELNEIRSADNAIKSWLKLKCLPYTDVGMLVLPNKHLDEVITKLDHYEKVERPVLVAAFVEAYPRLLEESKAKLGSLYNAGDYAPVEALTGVFYFQYNVFSFAVPEFLRHTRYDEEAQNKLQEKFHAAAEEITTVMRQTLLELVTNLSSQLAPAETEGKRKKLTTSALTKVQEFLNTFDARNITNDEELDAVVKQAKELLGTVEIDGLRKDGAFRETMATNMAGLQAQLAALMVDDSPDRKVRL